MYIFNKYNNIIKRINDNEIHNYLYIIYDYYIKYF